MKTYGGVEVQIHVFLTRPLYPQGKKPRYPLDRRLGRPRSQSGCGGDEKNSLPWPGIEPIKDCIAGLN
jgi:hypothetical protein